MGGQRWIIVIIMESHWEKALNFAQIVEIKLNIKITITIHIYKILLIGIFSKDTIISKYYLIKANKETSVVKAINYYAKSLK